MFKFKNLLYKQLKYAVSIINKIREQIMSLFLVIVVQSLSRVQVFCDLVDCSPPSSSVHGVSQVRLLGWVAISFSSRSS